jgi:hypothetical protein
MRDGRTPGRRATIRLVAVWVLAYLAVVPALATKVRPLNLEELTARAATIFSGTVVATGAAHDPLVGREVVAVTFAVDRPVKGARVPTLTVKLLGGDGVPGLPRFRPGEEVVLFLYGESRLGLSSPVGLGQGRFRVTTDKQGRRVAINDFGNESLLRGLTPAGQTRLGPALDAWKARPDVDAATLLDMAGALLAPGP